MRLVAAAVACASALSAAASATLVTTGREAQVVERPPDMIRIPGGEFAMGASDEELQVFEADCFRELGGEAASFICTEAGTFYRTFRAVGESCTDAGGCGRVVQVYDFDIDRLEVTTARYRECVEAGTCSATPLVSGDLRFIQEDWPIVNVTWSEAVTYCEWRGGRLPTEAEWEKAARGADGRRFPWGNQDSIDRANRGTLEDEAVRGWARLFETTFDEEDGSKLLVPPGSHPWGRSPYGVEDMAGNASEWVADLHSESGYAGLSTIDPRGPRTGVFRAVRGGGFDDVKVFSRTYVRWPAMPETRSVSRGFRCARDVNP